MIEWIFRLWSKENIYFGDTTMTTVIMISNDNSVIITNNDTPETSPVKNHLCSPDSGSGSSVDSPVLRGVQPKPGQNRKSYQSRKLSVSTVESDSEELNHSSSSTTSTLSSRSEQTYWTSIDTYAIVLKPDRYKLISKWWIKTVSLGS